MSKIVLFCFDIKGIMSLLTFFETQHSLESFPRNHTQTHLILFNCRRVCAVELFHIL